MDGSTSLAGRAQATDFNYRLDDRYERDKGSVFLTGPQALVRLALMQRRLDRRDGLDTAGFISGYRGSPLGGYDQALWRAAAFLERDDITFQPAINEDLAATAIMGTQQVETDPARTVEGVFAIWYGKGPGVDRSGDALKHGNAYGSSPHGGVLVVAGDDHGCVSSSMSHQSDLAMASWYMPVIHPAGLADYLDFGLWSFAASRFSGNWVGFKAISETVESARNVALKPLPVFETPADHEPPPEGLHYRWPDFPGMQVEHRAQAKLDALRAFARANPIDRLAMGRAGARLGIVTVGKAHLDLMEALAALGIDRRKAAKLGIAVYKVGLVWPIEDTGLRRFAAGKDEILVVEEKRPVVESQLKDLLYGGGKGPRIVGKSDEKGRPLVPDVDELRPSVLAATVANRAKRLGIELPAGRAVGRGRVDASAVDIGTATKRMPYFCSGCPHNSSTKVPDGSMAFGGIGCHFMASWMDRNTSTVIQMGGEGVHWAGRAPYTGNPHAFQNLGDGTYFHSGLMAIRQAVAAGINITYKILYNDAVAMTGGQPIDGSLTVPEVARQVREEGVTRVAVVSDEPWKYKHRDRFPKGTTVHHRDQLDIVQRDLRETPGVSALIYDQTCAAEKRRRRKRKQFPDPPKRAFINEAVCEGCGDCSVQSNCLSVVPVETELGRKRKIDQSSCNKDYSCLNGFCPSFVTVEGEGLELRLRPGAELPDDRFADRIEALPIPDSRIRGKVANLLLTGVGGTGIVTVGQILTMAGHLEGKSVSVLDFTGFAQKGGAVLSHIRIAPSPDTLNQVRIDVGSADLLLACDIVVATQPEPLAAINKTDTRVIVNRTAIPTADYVRDIKADLNYRGRLAALEQVAGKGAVSEIDANEIVAKLIGDTIYSNLFLAGFAWQQGLVPVGLEAVLRAIELNGVTVEANRRAFQLGRLAAGDPAFIDELVGPAPDRKPQSLDDLMARREAHLTAYQDAAYAADYRAFVDSVRRAEDTLKPKDKALTEAVAKSLFKLMAYKDEYEVARLYTDGSFAGRLGATFAGRFRLKLHMAPPLLAWRKDAQGRPKKLTLGGWWLMPALKVLAKLRRLRGTPLDVFGHTAERRTERRLVGGYRATIETLLAGLTRVNYPLAVEIARLPEDIRGFGPVKADNIEKAKVMEANLLEQYRTPATPQMAAE